MPCDHGIAFRSGRGARISVLATLLVAAAAPPVLAQIAGSANLGGPQPMVSTPIPDGDPVALAKDMGLVESDKPMREMVKGWTRPKKVIVFVDNNTNRIAWLQQVAPGVKLVPVRTHADAMAQIADTNGQLYGFCNKEVVKAGKVLNWVLASHGGVEECFGGEVPQELTSGKVVVTNFKRVLAETIADHALAMTLALGRGLDLFVRMNQRGSFDKTAIPDQRLWQIKGHTMLIVGLGGVGTDLAQRAHALGMHVIATRNTSHDGPAFVDYVGLSKELPDLIGKADVVVMCAPLTKDTTRLFDAAMFARMKKGAFFVNVARGEQVVTDDLVAALKSGQVGGAGVDVIDLKGQDAKTLYNTPNLFVTPHMSAHAAGADDASGGEGTWQIAREQLRRYVNGDKLYSIVDPKLGY
jgi:phosphoglycerate dehydrogenase-like enzyme